MDELNRKIQEKSISLLGERAIKSFQDKTIAVLGLGGVGGTALDALARSGFMNFFLVDGDRVDYSNLNRQILYTSADVGLRKVDCALSFLGELTDGICCTCAHDKITSENVDKLLDRCHLDFIIDAIDDVPAKVALIRYALSRDIPIVECGGMGNRVDPTKIEIIPLSEVTHDPLCRKLRSEIKKVGIDDTKIMVVHSSEEPMKKDPTPYAMIMAPSAAGLFICYYVVQHFLNLLPKEIDENDVGE